jgi:predicted RNase H-like nuclease (RuvC/YqgF family)
MSCKIDMFIAHLHMSTLHTNLLHVSQALHGALQRLTKENGTVVSGLRAQCADLKQQLEKACTEWFDKGVQSKESEIETLKRDLELEREVTIGLKEQLKVAGNTAQELQLTVNSLKASIAEVSEKVCPLLSLVCILISCLHIDLVKG